MNQLNTAHFFCAALHLFFYQIIAGCCITVFLYITTHSISAITIDTIKSYGFGILAMFLGAMFFSYRKQNNYSMLIKTKLLEISFINALLNVALMFIIFIVLLITRSQQGLTELVAMGITTLFFASIALVGLFFMIWFAMKLGLFRLTPTQIRQQISV